MRNLIITAIVIVASALTVSGCASGGESKDSLQYEWVNVPGYGRVLCIGQGSVGLACDFGEKK